MAESDPTGRADVAWIESWYWHAHNRRPADEEFVANSPEHRIGRLIEIAERFRSTDPNVSAVQELLRDRATVGLTKYGIDTTRTDWTVADRLQHLEEELLDAAIYLQTLKGKCPK